MTPRLVPKLRRVSGGIPKKSPASVPLTIVFIAFVATALLAAYYSIATKNSIFVSANTEILRLSFQDAEDQLWAFENAILCERVSRRASAATPDVESETCGTEHELLDGRFVVAWPKETDISVERRGTGSVEILILATEHSPILKRDDQTDLPLTQRMRIVIPASDFQNAGAFAFTGTATIGRNAVSGFSPLSLGGRYEIREALTWRTRTELMDEGRLFSGDVVSIVERQSLHGPMVPVETVEGFFAPRDTDGALGFQAVLSAGIPTGKLALELRRQGLGSTYIRARWSDRALADEITYAIIILLTLMATLLGMASHVNDLIANRHDRAQPPDTLSPSLKLRLKNRKRLRSSRKRR